MLVLTDNDVVQKLARCDLYQEFLRAFGVSFDDIQILPTARYVLTSTKFQKRLDAASVTRLNAFFDAVKDIAAEPNWDDLTALAEQPRIDQGEAALFSIGAATPDSLVATGDKRSLISLVEAAATNAFCVQIVTRLANRVICFEKVIHQIVTHFGFQTVRDKLIRGRECDSALAIVLGSGFEATESSVLEGLHSYINDLRTQTGAVLVE